MSESEDRASGKRSTTRGMRRPHRPARRCVDLLLLAVACGIAASAQAISIGPPVQIGSISHPSLDEISGIVDSRAHVDTLWGHNDSGDAARFYAIGHSGSLLGSFSLIGASAVDWEDIAIGPKPGGANYLYLGDVGDNDAVRSSVRVYRTDEPQSTIGAAISAAAYSWANLQYPNGPRDVESMFVDPVSNELFLITKRALITELYGVPTSAFDTPGQTVTVTAYGNVNVPRGATGADISPDGHFVVVRNSVSSLAYLYERTAGESVADALKGTGFPFLLGPESQGEAVAWSAAGDRIFTTSEFDGFSSAPIHAYNFAGPLSAPEPASGALLAIGLGALLSRRRRP